MVRQASLHVWKVIVSNTPKTVRDILPTLFELLLGCLASTNYDKREVLSVTSHYHTVRLVMLVESQYVLEITVTLRKVYSYSA